MKILFSCDCGLGDFIVSLPSALDLAERLNLIPAFLVGAAQYSYIQLIPSLNSFEIYTSINHLPKTNEIKVIYSVRTSELTLKRLKLFAKKLKIPFHRNLLHESLFSFVLRKLLCRVHFSDLPRLIYSSLLSKIAIMFSPQSVNYIVPPFSSLIHPSTIIPGNATRNSQYIVLSPAGSDPQRSLTYEQISLFASFSDYPIIVIGNSTLLDIPLAPNIINLVGKTDLKEAISLIAYSFLAVCMDSAFSHIAGAYGSVYSISIMGNASPMRWGPLPTQKNSHVVYANRYCSPCGKTSCTKFFGSYSCMQHPAFTYDIIKEMQKGFHEHTPSCTFS